MNTINVRFATGERLEIPYGTRVHELLADGIEADPADPVVACLVNNDLVSLSYKVKVNCELSPVRLSSAEGMATYRRSVCFLLAMAAKAVFPDRRLVIGHSLGDGYFYHFDGSDECPSADLERLDACMRELVGRRLLIRRTVVAYHEAVESFLSSGRNATAELLEFRNEAKIPVYTCSSFIDLAHGPLVADTGILGAFRLQPYDFGFILRFTAADDKDVRAPLKDSPLVFSIYREYKGWGKVLGVSSVGRLNRISMTREIRQFILVAEALHNKKIASIADLIQQRKKDLRVVLVAGPSSSGKTTFTKRLAIELTVLGFKPIMISLDDYFVARERTPRDEFGNYNFEALEALDIVLLNEHLVSLFEGGEVEIPIFDFKTGGRREQGRRLRLPENGILLLEGIHGLNDRLTPLVSAEKKFKIYVSALTQLNLDENNRISTTDNRLIRRLVRDAQFRGHDGHTTLSMWPSVRRGENRNIFPFQDSADAAFNSALDYELGVLKPMAETILRSVKPNHAVYHEATRLLSFLQDFLPIEARYVPEYSILREFIGASGFKY